MKIVFAGQLMMHALIRIDESTDPIGVNYYNLCGPTKGVIQAGILQWIGDEVCFNIAAPGELRPIDFTALSGSGRTLSQWRPKC